jgi:aspartate/methionine/tyrosine aminotransferase
VKIRTFALERYFARHEFSAPYLLCCSDCESLAVEDLLGMEPGAEEQLRQLWLGYTESSGSPSLRREIAQLYDHVEAEQVLVHAGAEEAIFTFMNTVLDPGDHVVVHYPCYQSLFEIARAIGCRVTRWVARPDTETVAWELDLDELRRHLRPDTKAVIVNCPHNPTGYLMSREKWQGLVALSQVHGFTLFSDEVYRLLEYDEEDRLPALCDVDDRGVSLGVMSKSFGLAGLRIGWIATRNQALYEKMAAYKDYTTICSSAPSEFLAELALRHKNEVLARNLDLVRSNLALLDRFFAEYETLFDWVPPRAGPIAFPSLRPETGVDAERFCEDLVTEAGVLLLPGAVYGAEYDRHFRVGFGRKNVAQCIDEVRTYLEKTIWGRLSRV